MGNKYRALYANCIDDIEQFDGAGWNYNFHPGYLLIFQKVNYSIKKDCRTLAK